MLDRNLAALYEVETRVFNQAVKRNLKRFPDDFMFQLTHEEWNEIKLRSSSSEVHDPLRSQIVILESGKGQHTKYLPYAFTEQGIAILSGILNSDKAIQMNIAIMRAFVEIRKIFLEQHDVRAQLVMIKERLGEHDVQLSQICDSIENLLDAQAAQRRWADRARIGFHP